MRVILATLLLLLPLAGQAALAPPPYDGKQVAAVRAETPPVLDGVLDDPVWAMATPLTDFHQVDPLSYGEPVAKPSVRVAFDAENLYLGAEVVHRDVADRRARIMVQTGRVWPDDRFIIVLDTFRDRRNGYLFEVNPNGLRGEAILENNTREIHEWNAIWYAEAQHTERGWTVEVRIPLASLSFDPAGDDWGVNFLWDLPGTGEFLAWNSQGWQMMFAAPGFAGTLAGLEDLEQGLGLDLIPSLSLKHRDDFVAGTSETRWEPSLDVLYKLSNATTLALTFNPDFSSTEPDDRQVNLTRFSLFFPEKRTFFLQDAGVFEFGGLTENGRPFFSRTIGLSPAGQPVDIIAGAKVTGREGDLSFGALVVQQDESATLDAQTVAVARAVRNVGESSSVGVIATSGAPRTGLSNTTVGVDWRYRDSRFLGDQTLEAQLWWQDTNTGGPAGDGSAWGAVLRYPNDTWNLEARLSEIDDGFTPGMGFVNRAGVRQTYARARYRIRDADGFWAAHNFIVFADRVEDLDGGLQSQKITVVPWAPWRPGFMYFELYHDAFQEVIDTPFDLFGRLTIAPGHYSFRRPGIFWEVAGGNSLSGWGSVDTGDFFDGESRHADWNLNWRPHPRFGLTSRLSWTDVSLPTGDFAARLHSLKTSVAITPKLAWITLAQHDNVSSRLGVDTRVRYTPRAGEEIALVVTRGAVGEPGAFASTTQEAVLKFLYTFRY